MANNLDYKVIDFPVSEKIMKRLKRNMTFSFMYFVMKMT